MTYVCRLTRRAPKLRGCSEAEVRGINASPGGHDSGPGNGSAGPERAKRLWSPQSPASFTSASASDLPESAEGATTGQGHGGE
jgi:hypothetical protein